jgi:hypothetical protein
VQATVWGPGRSRKIAHRRASRTRGIQGGITNTPLLLTSPFQRTLAALKQFLYTPPPTLSPTRRAMLTRGGFAHAELDPP